MSSKGPYTKPYSPGSWYWDALWSFNRQDPGEILMPSLKDSEYSLLTSYVPHTILSLSLLFVKFYMGLLVNTNTPS